MLKLPGRTNRKEGLREFAAELERIGDTIGFKISARGWCYQLEGFGLITKAEFDRVENLVNTCRKGGYLPIDFTAEEEARQFSGVEKPEQASPLDFMKRLLKEFIHAENYYTPDWWDGEEYYIQMIVEKIDLKTLFEPVCSEYHIPIATTKGWSSMHQRAEYAKRFNDAEQRGLQCVLLYCGDHDPDGLRISEFLRSNLEELVDLTWEGGDTGYDPANLKIDRFGLDYPFIVANNLTWINNLITGSKRDLASPSHPNHYLPYVQDYLAKYGARKCEANALVVRPRDAEDLVRQAIEKYLGNDALERFRLRREPVLKKFKEIRSKANLEDIIKKALEKCV